MPLIIHRVCQVEFRGVLAKHNPQRRQGRELADLVENGTGRLGPISLVVLRVLPRPKSGRDWIPDPGDHAGAKFRVRIEARQFNERGARRRQQGDNAVK